MNEFFREIISFIERDDIEVKYREEETFFTKKSLMPSGICRIKEVSSSGKKLVIVEEEIYPDDTTIAFHQILYELSNNWLEPKRLTAFMYTAEDGRPVFSDEDLYRRLRELWGLIL